MTNDERQKVLSALVAAHVYLMHLPGRVFYPDDEGDHCGKYYCFACQAPSGKNHEPDCEVLAIVEQVGEAREIATLDMRKP